MLAIGDRVEVYWNLHKGLYSVRKDGIVVEHTTRLALEDVKFSVQPAGREKVLREKKKNVHAFVRGRFVGTDHDYRCAKLVTYNPYKYASFVDSEENEVHEAKCVFLTMNGAGMPKMMKG